MNYNIKNNPNLYKKIINIDSILLFSITIIFTVLQIFLIVSTTNETYILEFIKSIIFIILESTIICNIKTENRVFAILAFITGIIVSFSSIKFVSFFSIIYFFLGIIYLCHSVFYLKSVSKLCDNQKKKTKKIYLTLLPNLFGLMFIIGYKSEIVIGLVIYLLIILFNILNIVLCESLLNRYKESLLVYISRILSIIIIIFNGLFFIDSLCSLINK